MNQRRFFLLALGLIVLPQASYSMSQCLDAFGGPSESTRGFSKELPAINLEKVVRSGAPRSQLSQNTKLAAANLSALVLDNYGPLTMKYQVLGLDWTTLQRDLNYGAGRAKTSNDGYYLFADFVAKFNDAHVSVMLPSSLVYHVPVQLRAAENRLFVQTTTDIYPSSARKLAQGDEIVAINGKSPIDFMNTFGSWRASGNPETSLAQFALGFPEWKEARGIPLSKFSALSKDPEFAHINDQGVQLTVKPKSGEAAFDVQLPFSKEGIGLVGKGLNGNPDPEAIVGKYRPKKEEVNPFDALVSVAPATTQILGKFDRLVSTRLPVLPIEANAAKTSLLKLGQQEPFFPLPQDFKPIELPAATKAMKTIISDDVYKAGTFTMNGERVGFLRIASYSPKNLVGSITALRYLIAKLEAQSDYLVIDQTNNPGGYVILSDIVVKSLTGKWDASKHLQFSVKPSSDFIRQYREIKEQIDGNADGLFTPEEVRVVSSMLEKDIQKMVEARDRGLDLSEPISMLPMSAYVERAIDRALGKKITDTGLITKLISKFLFKTPESAADLLKAVLGVDIAKTQVYTKETYFMINELDYSGGDATPASLKDYGRVRLVGYRTAGAGASVGTYELNNFYRMQIHLSEALMRRQNPSHPLVENYGVPADLAVPLLASDVQSGYQTYFPRVMQEILKDRQTRR